MKHILEEMKCDPDEKYEECVETLSRCSWTPTEDQLQRNDRLRATPIEHEDDENTVELESGNVDYLSSRTIDELKQWLEQHDVGHIEKSKAELVRLVSKKFAITTPIRIMPKLKFCRKTVRGTRTRSVVKSLHFIDENETSNVETKRDNEEDEEDGLQRRLMFTM